MQFGSKLKDVRSQVFGNNPQDGMSVHCLEAAVRTV